MVSWGFVQIWGMVELLNTGPSSDPGGRLGNTAVTFRPDSISVRTKGKYKSREKTSDKKGRDI